MNSLCSQLTRAYRQQERLYIRVRELVEEQSRIVETNPSPNDVLDVCNQVEALLAEIAVIEEAIKPAKQQWERAKRDPDGELDSVLGAIQKIIEDTARTQEKVQRRLVDYARLQKERANGARGSIIAMKAHLAYRPG